ncbi:S-layer homology domain-containing protein [Cytobacillus oceanisediminis]|uniref:S-layer homology domain-containing protein n=1 Tax=Cytobacillus oceanisediminis TaxID=665099 RepID=UPI00373578F6
MKKWMGLLFLCFFIFIGSASAAESLHFRDVKSDHWAKNDIHQLFYRGIIQGYDDGTFKPNNIVTIAQFVKMAVVANQLPVKDGSLPFSVPAKHWAKPYISTAYTAGLITAADFGSALNPNHEINREQMTLIMARSLKLEPVDKAVFKDQNSIKNKGLVVAAYEAGVISGKEDGTFRPAESSTRAQSAAVLERMLRIKGAPTPMTLEQGSNIIATAEKKIIDILGNEIFENYQNPAPFSTLKPKVTVFYTEKMTTDTWQRVYEEYPGWLYEPNALIPFTMERLNFTVKYDSQTSTKAVLSFRSAADEAGYASPGIWTYTLVKENGKWLIGNINHKDFTRPFTKYEGKLIIQEQGLWSEDEKGAAVNYLATDKKGNYVYGIYKNNKLIKKKTLNPKDGYIYWF